MSEPLYWFDGTTKRQHTEAEAAAIRAEEAAEIEAYKVGQPDRDAVDKSERRAALVKDAIRRNGASDETTVDRSLSALAIVIKDLMKDFEARNKTFTSSKAKATVEKIYDEIMKAHELIS